jgi:hypothetical protein
MKNEIKIKELPRWPKTIEEKEIKIEFIKKNKYLNNKYKELIIIFNEIKDEGYEPISWRGYRKGDVFKNYNRYMFNLELEGPEVYHLIFEAVRFNRWKELYK